SGQSIIEQRDALTLELVAQTPPYPTESGPGCATPPAAPPGVFGNITGVDGSVSILDEALATIANVPILDVGPLEMVAAGDAGRGMEGQGLDGFAPRARGEGTRDGGRPVRCRDRGAGHPCAPREDLRSARRSGAAPGHRRFGHRARSQGCAVAEARA